MKELPVIFNPVADRGRAKEKLLKVEGHLRELGFSPKVFLTSGPGEAARESPGSLSKRARSLWPPPAATAPSTRWPRPSWEQKTALGIIPLGSGNDFLRSLAGEVDFQKALRRLREGKPTPVDVGEANSRFYLNSLGMGIDGQIAEDFIRWKFLRGELGYLWAALWEVARFRPFALQIRSDVGEFSMQGLMVSVMNGSHTAGGFHLAPGASLTDGALNLIAISHYPRILRVPILVRVRQGKHLGLKGVRAALVKWAEVKTSRPLRVYVDGELLPRTTELRIRVHPGALRVVL